VTSFFFIPWLVSNITHRRIDPFPVPGVGVNLEIHPAARYSRDLRSLLVVVLGAALAGCASTRPAAVKSQHAPRAKPAVVHVAPSNDETQPDDDTQRDHDVVHDVAHDDSHQLPEQASDSEQRDEQPSDQRDPSPPLNIETGFATWYGDDWHGKPTASGQKFNKHKLTAAHRTLPLGSKVRVTNTKNGKWVEVTINDRGPYGRRRERIIDMAEAAAKKLGMIDAGVCPVRIELLWQPPPKKKRSKGKRGRHGK
jgi:rare lipoprotein A